RQVDVLRQHPEVDIACSGARRFGLVDRVHAMPPGDGVLDPRQFARIMYRGNQICASTALVRHRLFELVGPFRERLASEDYDYWLRALAAGAVFYYDPAVLVRYRQHEGQVTSDRLGIYRETYLVHRWHAGVVDNSRLVRSVHAEDLLGIGRQLVGDGHPGEASRAFRHSLRYASAGSPFA